MVIENVKIFTDKRCFRSGLVVIRDGKIEDVCLQDHLAGKGQEIKYTETALGEWLDGGGSYLIPGMIDIHLHGCKGYDFCDGTLEAVEQIAREEAALGVTTLAPATMTLPITELEKILQIIDTYQKGKQGGKYEAAADLAGVNMEGPFISRAKKGAQKEEFILPPDREMFRRLQKAAGGMIRYMGVAPEEAGAGEFIEVLKDEVKITLAHTNAGYDTAREAFWSGASHVTHLYNGMPEYGHREPGIVGAVADCKHVEAELIGDGVHVHPAVIRATFSLLGKERIILISDSIRATGMPSGAYELGGQMVEVKEKIAVVEGTDTIAGSVTSLPDCFRYVVKKAGIPLEDAVICVTENPARSLGIFSEFGSVTKGKRADLVLLDEELKVQTVIKAGKVLPQLCHTTLQNYIPYNK